MLQTLYYRDLPSLKEIAVSSVSSFNTNGVRDKLLMFTPHDSLVRLVEILDVIGTDEDEVDAYEESRKLALSSTNACFGTPIFFLSLQYLTQHDYHLRTIRDFLKDTMESSSPVLNAEGVIEFTTQAPIRAEWDSLKRQYVVYLLTVVPPHEQADTDTLIFCELFGVQAVRGAEVIKVGNEDRPLHVLLDLNQYDFVIHHNPKESNTKAVLDSIRTMIVDGVSKSDLLGDVPI
ncbi:hypothetical protein BLNAU_13277 [Blattamonas nauphoetae]|uniref:RNA helicase aquarius beta-barrel domain-containing protein n=1 Tax=Blattamonas nauphoetae TaxID=2049346 RepID=A0ABQ9XJ69_9EUKA|nr:hypothetical protein BLNAU_13277 [Blattamonas nauphoetae]